MNEAPSPATWHSEVNKDRTAREDKPRPQGCLLSDLHHGLHSGERCPECGYCFEEVG